MFLGIPCVSISKRGYGSDVLCYMNTNYISKIAELEPYQTVDIKGVYWGLSEEDVIIMRGCVIIE